MQFRPFWYVVFLLGSVVCRSVYSAAEAVIACMHMYTWLVLFEQFRSYQQWSHSIFSTACVLRQVYLVSQVGLCSLCRSSVAMTPQPVVPRQSRLKASPGTSALHAVICYLKAESDLPTTQRKALSKKWSYRNDKQEPWWVRWRLPEGNKVNSLQ